MALPLELTSPTFNHTRQLLHHPVTIQPFIPRAKHFVHPARADGRVEFVGAGACHGLQMTGEPSPDLAEVVLRIGVRGREKGPVERFTKELAPLALNGPPGVTGLGSGRPKVEEIVAYWPALIPKTSVTPVVSVKEA